MNTFRNIRELYQIRLEACKGFPEESLLQAEKRLKTTLPETFRKYYLEIGADETVNQSYNHLLPPWQLYYKSRRGYVGYSQGRFRQTQPSRLGRLRHRYRPRLVLGDPYTFRLLAIYSHLQRRFGRFAIQCQYYGKPARR